MPHQLLPTERLQKLFHRRKCWMLAELALALDYALISVRRFLNEVGYFRSYTDNGKWYTLQDSPQFNREGIWHYKDIGFSKHGSLTATICYLVGRSPEGLSARELAQKLQHPCHAVLTNLHKAGALDRVQVQGEFRYLSITEQLNRRQREQASASQPPSAATSLSTQAAVWVLVEHIKHCEWSFQQIADYLRQQRALNLSPESIGRFFQEHDLKKTPNASTPER
jgi:transposase